MAATPRTKQIRNGLEKIVLCAEQIREADSTHKQIVQATHQDVDHSLKWKEERIAKYEAVRNSVFQKAGNAIIEAAESVSLALEAEPEPVDVSRPDVQNTLSLLTMTDCELSYSQLAYFIDLARGDYMWLKMLHSILTKHNRTTEANYCASLMADFPLFQLEQIAMCAGTVLRFNTYTDGDWFYPISRAKQYLRETDPSVVKEESYAEQVKKLKAALAERNAENEALRSTFADGIKLSEEGGAIMKKAL